MTLREIAIRYAWTWLGRPYLWGGDDPSGIDCSGLVIEILQGVGLLPDGFDTTAQGLYDKFRTKKINEPRLGTLVFYQNKAGLVIHVGLVIERNIVLQAGGGGAATTSPAEAWKQNAFVKLRPIDYRKELRLYVDPFQEN